MIEYVNVAEVLGMEYLLPSVRREFYSSRSLVGTAPLGHSIDDYQSGVSPYHAAMAIIESENAIKRRITAKEKRLALYLNL